MLILSVDWWLRSAPFESWGARMVVVMDEGQSYYDLCYEWNGIYIVNGKLPRPRHNCNYID